MGMLDIGAGAAQGLEQLLTRLRADDMFEEQKRSRLASEGLQARQIDENSALRREMEAGRQQDRAERLKDKTAAQTMQILRMRPIGTEISPETMQRELETGATPDFYEQTTKQVGDDGPDGQLPIVRFRGTADQQEAAARIKQSEENAKNLLDYRKVLDENADLSRQIRDHAEQRQTSYGPPVINIFDPNAPGGSRPVPRGSIQAGGANAGAVNPPPTAERQKIDAYKTTLDLIKDIEDPSFDEKTWNAALGMFDSTVGAKAHEYLGMNMGGGAQGESLRTRLNRLRAQASFAEGGKNFTGTENELLNSFLTQVQHNPKAARERLAEFRRALEISLTRLTGGSNLNSGGSNGNTVDNDPAGLFR